MLCIKGLWRIVYASLLFTLSKTVIEQNFSNLSARSEIKTDAELICTMYKIFEVLALEMT